jgi:two-component system response regulator HydG
MMGSQCTSGDDVPPLARVLLADAALRMKRMLGGLAPGAADQMLCYVQNEWAGNAL